MTRTLDGGPSDAPDPPQRRASDAGPSPRRRAIDRTLAVFLLVFSIAFFYQLAEVFAKHTCWCDFIAPPAVGEILTCLVSGLGAIATALGLNVGSLMKGLQHPDS